MKRHETEEAELEAMLARRTFEPAHEMLAERIADAARRTLQRHSISLWVWLNRLCGEFHIARPGYVLASVLALGFLSGFYLHVNGVAESESMYVQEFLYAEGATL